MVPAAHRLAISTTRGISHTNKTYWLRYGPQIGSSLHRRLHLSRILQNAEHITIETEQFEPNAKSRIVFGLHELAGDAPTTASAVTVWETVPRYPASTSNVTVWDTVPVNSDAISSEALPELEVSENGTTRWVPETFLEEKNDATEEETVPWFLQVDTPQPRRNPLAERQALPELPENPPSELPELFKQLSEENGIYDIKLADLRYLDPPPAIGSDTIMVFGTARSIRHLHATADKISRWMRSTYGWSVEADGLLGRNELKLINRRKRRRGKVVSDEMGEVAEAGSSGWVCVHAKKQGLVVQLFVQSKREEMDLEGLWGTILERHRIRMRREVEKMDRLRRRHGVKLAEEREEEEIKGEVVEEEYDFITSKHVQPPSISSVNGSIMQKRTYTTNNGPRIRRVNNQASRQVLDLASDPGPLYRKPRVENANNVVSSTELTPESIDAGLDDHLDHLKSHPDPSSLLGAYLGDKSSTSFLKTFYKELEKKDPITQLTFEIKFLGLANTIKQESYPIRCLEQYLYTSKAQGMPVGLEHCYLALQYISAYRPATGNWDGTTDSRIGAILSIFREMNKFLDPEESKYLQRRPEFKYVMFQALAPDSISNFRKAVLRGDLESPEVFAQMAQFGKINWDRRIELGGNFPQESRDVVFSYTIKEHHLDMITGLAVTGQWDEVWSIWARMATYGITRTSDYYDLMVGLAVCSGRQKVALKCVKLLPDFMAREFPVVEMSHSLAEIFARLLAFAERHGHRSSENDKLRARCLTTLTGAPQ